MFRLVLVLSVWCLMTTTLIAQEKDINWSFEKRLVTVEDKVAQLEKQLTVLRTAKVGSIEDPVRRFGAPSAKMQAIGLSWFDISTFVNHLVNLLETQGPTVIHIVRNGLKLIQAVTDRDLSQIIQMTMTFSVDVPQLIAAIRTEFGITAVATGGPPIAASGVVVQSAYVTGSSRMEAGPIRSIIQARPIRGFFGRLFGRARGGC